MTADIAGTDIVSGWSTNKTGPPGWSETLNGSGSRGEGVAPNTHVEAEN